MIPEISTGIVTGKRSLCHKGECVCYTLRGAMPSAGSNLPSWSAIPTLQERYSRLIGGYMIQLGISFSCIA
ncbi:hypothetical protein FHX06_005984 [Rhizobium sp. BK512]|nr:hypothetical protein [Rhizobium sp. BK512]